MRNDLSPFTPACLEDRRYVSSLLEGIAPLMARVPMLRGILAVHAHVDEQYEMLAQVNFVCDSIVPGEPPSLRSWESLDLDIFDARTLFEIIQTLAGHISLDRTLRAIWKQGGQTGDAQPFSTLITPDAVIFEMQGAFDMLRDMAIDDKVDPTGLTQGERQLVLSVMPRSATSNHEALEVHRKALDALRVWTAIRKNEAALWADVLGLRIDEPRPTEMLSAVKET